MSSHFKIYCCKFQFQYVNQCQNHSSENWNKCRILKFWVLRLLIAGKTAEPPNLQRRYTLSKNDYGPFAILWSKSAIFRGAWQNVDMQLHPWTPTALIPHFRAFKRGILLCCISRGSKVTSFQSLNVYILHHFP